MKDPAIVIRDHLQSLGLGEAAGTSPFDLYIGQWPNVPNAAVLINRTGGLNPLPHLSLNYPSVQITVRGAPNGYIAASNRMEAIVNALLGIQTLVLGGDTYRACNQIGDVFYLGQDDKTRPMLSANFRFIVEPALMAGGHRSSIS